MPGFPSPPLNNKEREAVFRLATSGLVSQHKNQFQSGMTDTELEEALKQCLGIFGGSGGPDRLSISYAGAGLRIWGGHQTVNHVVEQPLFSGKQTIAMVREIYGIADPDCDQPALL